MRQLRASASAAVGDVDGARGVFYGHATHTISKKLSAG